MYVSDIFDTANSLYVSRQMYLCNCLINKYDDIVLHSALWNSVFCAYTLLF